MCLSTFKTEKTLRLNKTLLHYLILFLGLVVYFSIPKDIFAADFFVDSNYYYEINDEGRTKAQIDVTIENATSEKLVKKYLLNLKNFEPININVTNSEGDELNFHEERREGHSLLEIEFGEVNAGIGKQNSFQVNFDTYTLATKTGETWEISIPKLHEDETIRDYLVNIKTPDSFGEQAFVSPDPSSVTEFDNSKLYRFEKNKILSSNINLFFGQFQTYSFSLKYHLENPLEQISQVELAIPPDTGYQTVLYEELFPKPNDVVQDADGNWLAMYELAPRQKMDVDLKGIVKIYSFYRKDRSNITPSNLLANTKSTEYWQVNDPDIQELSKKLRTPEAIYNFVVSTLTYNHTKTYSNDDRLGALQALNNRQDALCTEFTDLFIALARASGIPAREINGFAYSNNQRIQPLSLVDDVLHAWPEYWDENNQKWVPVDPTWESTTGGRDYFNSFDVNHFAFVIHGRSDTEPYPPASYKLGPEPQKDIMVIPAESSLEEVENIQIDTEIENKSFSTEVPIAINIKNRGNMAIYNRNAYLYQDSELIKTYKIDQILPYGNNILKENIEYGLFARNAPDSLKIVIGDTEATVSTQKEDVLVLHLLLTLGSLSIIVILIFLRIKPQFNFRPRINLIPIRKRYNKLFKSLKDRNEPIFQDNEE